MGKVPRRRISCRLIIGWLLSRPPRFCWRFRGRRCCWSSPMPSAMAGKRPSRSLPASPWGYGVRRALGRQCWRQLRQCVGGNHQRPLQGRDDPPPGTLAQLRSGRTRHPRMGRLVQPPPPLRSPRPDPTRRVRRDPLPSNKLRPRGRDSNQTACMKPGAVQLPREPRHGDGDGTDGRAADDAAGGGEAHGDA